MVSGHALGGLVVAFLGVRAALVADAGAFGASALLISLGVRYRSAAAGPAARGTSRFAVMFAGVRLVFDDARCGPSGCSAGWSRSTCPDGPCRPVRGELPRLAGSSDRHRPGVRREAFRHRSGRGDIRSRGSSIGQAALDGPDGGCRLRHAAALLAADGPARCAVDHHRIGACASYQLAANAAFVACVPPEPGSSLRAGERRYASSTGSMDRPGRRGRFVRSD
jgi:hypothetical protein